MVGVSPLGDPLELEVRGSRLFPLMKVYRRLTVGEEEDLRAFYTMVTDRLGSPVQVNLDLQAPHVPAPARASAFVRQ